MGWKRIGLMRRPAAGEEARERASFLVHRKAQEQKRRGGIELERE